MAAALAAAQTVPRLHLVVNCAGVLHDADSHLRPEKRLGSDATWDKAEGALRHAIEAAGLPGGVFNLVTGFGPVVGEALADALPHLGGRELWVAITALERLERIIRTSMEVITTGSIAMLAFIFGMSRCGLLAAVVVLA